MASKVEVQGALIKRLREGDETSFRAIYDQLHGPIYRIFHKRKAKFHILGV